MQSMDQQHNDKIPESVFDQEKKKEAFVEAAVKWRLCITSGNGSGEFNLHGDMVEKLDEYILTL